MKCILLERGLAQRGDQVVVVASTPFTRRRRTNFLKAYRITGGA